MKKYLLSFDFGGTKTKIILYDENLKKLKSEFFETSLIFSNSKNKLYCLKKFLYKTSNKYNKFCFKKVGVGVSGVVKNNKIFFWRLLGVKRIFDLKLLMLKYFKFKEFNLLNDLIAAAKSEIFLGYGNRYKNFLLVNLGTGIKVVNVLNKKIIEGYKGLAGEIGIDSIYIKELNENIFIEDIISGSGIMKMAKKIFNIYIEPKEVFVNKKFIFLSEIFSKYLAEVIYRTCLFYNQEVIIFNSSVTLSKKYWYENFINFLKIKPKIFLPKKILFSNIKDPVNLGVLL